MRVLFSVLFFSLVSLQTAASEQDQIDRLFTAMDADSMLDEMYKQMEIMFANMRQQMNVSEEESHIYDKYNKKMTTLMREEMSWKKMEPEMRNIYLQNFTTEEIDVFIEFYESPAGKMFVKKMPVVMQESMQVGQQMAMQAMPKIQQISSELSSELEAYREETVK